MNFKALLNPKFLTSLVILISGALGLNEVSDHYTIEPKAQPVEVTIAMPEKDWTPLINEISEKRDNAHLEEYHGGR